MVQMDFGHSLLSFRGNKMPPQCFVNATCTTEFVALWNCGNTKPDTSKDLEKAILEIGVVQQRFEKQLDIISQ